jgi:hypothetical protein
MVLQYERCEKCGEKYIDSSCLRYEWCKPCQINYLKDIRTNGIREIDDFIEEMQLKISSYKDIIFEWIPYDQFNNIKKMGCDDIGYDTIYSAIWKNGPLCYEMEWIRESDKEVELKYLYNCQNLTEFFDKV